MQERPDLDAIEARLAVVRKRIEALSWDDYNVRLIAKPLLLEDIPALLAYVRELEAALKAVEPHLDAIVCYASTMSEHDGNRVAKLVRDTLEPKP